MRYVTFFTTLRHLPVQALLIVALALFCGRATAQTLDVYDQPSLLAALHAAKGGEVIVLHEGSYGTLHLRGDKGEGLVFDSPVTLRSADPARPAVINELEIAKVNNLTFDGLRFKYIFAPGNKANKRIFSISDAQDIIVRNSVFEGDVATDGDPAEVSLPSGIALSMPRVTRARVENNLFTGFHRGIAMGRGVDVVIRGNELRDLRMDGMVFVQMQDTLIEGNFIHDFKRSTLKSDHADMIQFWTNRSDAPTERVTIRGNVLLAGPGGATQSIFMRNDQVDRGLAGEELFYRDITIEDNVIVNGHTNGIVLGEALGVVIRNNTLLRHPAYATGENLRKSVRVPRLRLSTASRNVRVTANIAGNLPKSGKGWDMADNLVLQDTNPTQPGYYATWLRDFPVQNPQSLESYVPRKAGGQGSALLNPDADRSAFRVR
jgi:hypothetical protein